MLTERKTKPKERFASLYYVHCSTSPLVQFINFSREEDRLCTHNEISRGHRIPKYSSLLEKTQSQYEEHISRCTTESLLSKV